MHQYKVCKTCNANLPLNEFHAARDNADGKRNTCKSCTALKDKERYAKKAKENRARSLAYYHANKKQRTVYAAERYWKNREAISEKKKKIRQENIWHYKKLERASYQRKKDKKRAAASAYDKANPEKARTRNARRRARLKDAVTKQITPKEIKRLYQSSCFFCGSAGPVDIDHSIPLSRGGSHSIGNLLPLCDNCNSTKYNKTIMEWRLYRLRIGNPLPIDTERNV